MYFVSEVLHGPKVYKLLYTVLLISCKLGHYFQAHKITVPSTFPLGEILHNREAIGRISNWAIELDAFDIRFIAQTTVKS